MRDKIIIELNSFPYGLGSSILYKFDGMDESTKKNKESIWLNFKKIDFRHLYDPINEKLYEYSF